MGTFFLRIHNIWEPEKRRFEEDDGFGVYFELNSLISHTKHTSHTHCLMRSTIDSPWCSGNTSDCNGTLFRNPLFDPAAGRTSGPVPSFLLFPEVVHSCAGSSLGLRLSELRLDESSAPFFVATNSMAVHLHRETMKPCSLLYRILHLSYPHTNLQAKHIICVNSPWCSGLARLTVISKRSEDPRCRLPLDSPQFET